MVLLLRLEGPMQSWGTQSRFTERDTAREPTKSGVIGLLCAALGRTREKAVDDIAGLMMAVRVDREGIMMKDFHTTLDVITADGKPGKNAVVSNRYFLSDAAFLVGFEGHDDILRTIFHSLKNPTWPLFLGRKAFVPSKSVFLKDGLMSSSSLIDVLCSYPCLSKVSSAHLRLVSECQASEGFSVNDVPISFAERTFTLRYIRHSQMPAPKEVICF